ncbi:outer membrane lipoprotein [Paraburkholderia jirisanensis]
MERSMMTAATAALLCSVALSACATVPAGSADMYSSFDTQREASVRMGTVESVRPVTIDASNGQPGVFGAIGGGLLGAVAGSAIGHGRGSLFSGILGGVAGAVAGDQVQTHLERHQGEEITVRLDDGALRAVTQSTGEGRFYPGERVQLLSEGGVTRVTY